MLTPIFKKSNNTITYLFIYILCALILPSAELGAEPKETAADKDKTKSQWSAPILVYQKTLSRADGDRCPMYPSCSRYALAAFKRYNFFSACVLTSDRLLRCGHDEKQLSKRVRVGRHVKIHDPLSANTFWWEKP